MHALLQTLVLAACLLPGAENEPQLAPGRESRIDSGKVGGGYFVVYVPTDYVAERRWPVIFCYHGQNGKPTPWPFREVLGGKGFIIVGMGYLDERQQRLTTAEFDRYMAREVECVEAAAAYVARRLSVDKEEFFVGGFSMGGWMASSMGEATPATWAGIAILGAGRQKFDLPMRNPRSLRSKPIYIGVGDNDPNFPHAKTAVQFYEKLGAKVTFEEYEGLGHQMKADSKVLRDWLWANGTLRVLKPRLAAARAAEQAGKLGKAYALYQDVALVSEADAACAAAASAAKAIAQEAEKQLAAAEKATADKHFEEASRLLARLATRYEGSPFGAKADALIRKLQSDPEAQAAVKTTRPEPEPVGPSRPPSSPDQAERECRVWLSMADNFIRAKRPDLARDYLNRIIEKHGETEWGTKARERLAKLEK